MIYGYTSSSSVSNLVIPSTLGGKPVVRIDNYSFTGRTELRSVYIPSSVTHIGSGAFSETGLELLDTELLEELTGDEESGWFSSSSGRWVEASTSVEAETSASALALSSDAAGSEEESGTVDAA